jgi:putative transport protein
VSTTLFVDALRQHPELAVFLTLAVGFFVGRMRIGSFSLGTVLGGLFGLLVAFTPHVAAVLFGRYVLRMNPVILLGACSGAGTNTAALRAIQDAAGSKVPALGYTVPYAIGNIILTAWGPVIVALMS